MLFGMNILVFTVVVWVLAIAIAWCCDYGPEICREQVMYQKALRRWRESQKSEDPETTVEMEHGSFDPDQTMELRKVKTFEFHNVFVMAKKPPEIPRRRHARGRS